MNIITYENSQGMPLPNISQLMGNRPKSVSTVQDIKDLSLYFSKQKGLKVPPLK